MRAFIGYDGREPLGYEVAVRSMRSHASQVDPEPLVQAHLRAMGLYWRPEARVKGVRWDVISDAPMSTEFSLTRFLVPTLCGFEGWALFCDCDFLFRADVTELMELADPSKAVMVVMHQHNPIETEKMDGQPQTSYWRKNWSSLILWNCAHPAHRSLTLNEINSVPGLKLHAFWWLADVHIGELPLEWNWLEGVSDASIDPKAVHYTRGTPDMAGYENSAHADEWRSYFNKRVEERIVA